MFAARVAFESEYFGNDPHTKTVFHTLLRKFHKADASYTEIRAVLIFLGVDVGLHLQFAGPGDKGKERHLTQLVDQLTGDIVEKDEDDLYEPTIETLRNVHGYVRYIVRKFYKEDNGQALRMGIELLTAIFKKDDPPPLIVYFVVLYFYTHRDGLWVYPGSVTKKIRKGEDAEFPFIYGRMNHLLEMMFEVYPEDLVHLDMSSGRNLEPEEIYDLAADIVEFPEKYLDESHPAMVSLLEHRESLTKRKQNPRRKSRLVPAVIPQTSRKGKEWDDDVNDDEDF